MKGPCILHLPITRNVGYSLNTRRRLSTTRGRLVSFPVSAEYWTLRITGNYSSWLKTPLRDAKEREPPSKVFGHREILGIKSESDLR
jgi:hypothetical protein